MMYRLCYIPPIHPSTHISTHPSQTTAHARVLALAVGEGALEVGVEGEEDEGEGNVPRQRREGALVPVVVWINGVGC